jgi:hypothetical protein
MCQKSNIKLKILFIEIESNEEKNDNHCYPFEFNVISSL